MENIDNSQFPPYEGLLSEEQRRINKMGSDVVRVARGENEKYSLEEKVTFTSEEAQRIKNLINNSPIDQPWVKGQIKGLISKALQSDKISYDEAGGLMHYIQNAEGFSDEPKRDLDFRERQAGGN